jgi:hypothetical protein
MEIAAFHPSGTRGFVVAPGFLKNLRKTGLQTLNTVTDNKCVLTNLIFC